MCTVLKNEKLPFFRIFYVMAKYHLATCNAVSYKYNLQHCNHITGRLLYHSHSSGEYPHLRSQFRSEKVIMVSQNLNTTGIFLTVLALLQIITPSYSFGDFKLPSFPWSNGNPVGAAIAKGNSKVLQPGDTVAVVGASGNVGKLVALRLSDTYNVNGIVRDAASIETFFEGRSDRIKLFEANLLDEMDEERSGCPASLRAPLQNANAIVICTGTTAFPTKA